jgi:hypothetical protein
MFRYRCPHCRQLLQALEIRAGKTTICSKCSQQLTIPADRSEWLNEQGEPLLSSPTAVLGGGPITHVRRQPAAGGDRAAAGADDSDDVLGAIFIGGEPAGQDPISDDVVGSEPNPDRMSDVGMEPPPADNPPPAPVPAPRSRVNNGKPSRVFRRGVIPDEPDPPAEPPAAPQPPGRDEAPPEPAAPAEPPAAAAEVPPPGRSEPAPAPDLPAPRSGVPSRADVTEPDPTRFRPTRSEGRRPRRMVVTSPAPPPAGPAPVAAGDPYQLRNQADIAAGLTAVLTTRMKPPPEPPRDLKLSTALWLLLTGVGVALLLLALTTSGEYLRAVVYIGAAQIAAGYLWVVWMAARRDWRRGLLCAVPPLTAWYLTRRRYARYRPLRFVVTGAVLIVAAAGSLLVQPQTRSWAAEVTPTPAPPANVADQPKVVQLRHYRQERAYDPLIELLRTLAKTDPAFSGDARYRPELVAELRTLCDHPQSDVKVEALAAYARWGGEDARGLCLAASRSPSQGERMMALRLLPRWKDPEVARAVASRIGRPSYETTFARDALLEIGGPAAEQATIPLLRSEEQNTRLTAIDILEKVGGPDAVEALKDLAATTDDAATRQRATAKAQAIQARLQKK